MDPPNVANEVVNASLPPVDIEPPTRRVGRSLNRLRLAEAFYNTSHGVAITEEELGQQAAFHIAIAQALNQLAPIEEIVPPTRFTSALDARIAAANTALDERIAAANTALDERIAAANTALDARIAAANIALDARIATLETALDAKIATLHTDLDTKIAPIFNQMDKMFIQQQIQGAMIFNGSSDNDTDTIRFVPNGTGVTYLSIFPATRGDIRTLSVEILDELLAFYGEAPSQESVVNKQRRFRKLIGLRSIEGA